MKLNYIILFSLFFIVSLAAGCTSSVKEEMNPIIVSQLNLTDSKKQSLTGSLQGIHQTETGENISLSVHQTLGNERELYVLYDVTFGKEIDISTENNCYWSVFTRRESPISRIQISPRQCLHRGQQSEAYGTPLANAARIHGESGVVHQ